LVAGYSASTVASVCGGQAGAPGAQLLISLNSAIEAAVDLVNSAVAADIKPSVDLKFIPFSAGDAHNAHAVWHVSIAPEVTCVRTKPLHADQNRCMLTKPLHADQTVAC
jgi:hypothetical protein